ncbi:uncharacterized protein ARMOST_20151 [Armillaria ostoyae]|uniref:Uncharacterized protein n=1 Tax=Armillaria ostoyae TaxID=47428 RepID=A0A284S6J5_ARMOS|nr:uncharacterized protein ARMOST_20151 [Armillaria ostoyae]
MTTEFTNRERYLVHDIAIMNSQVVKESLFPRADIESSPDQIKKGMEHIHCLGLKLDAYSTVGLRNVNRAATVVSRDRTCSARSMSAYSILNKTQS